MIILTFKMLNKNINILSSLIHTTYSKSYTVIYDQFNEAIKIPQKWIEDIKQVEFSELLATSIGPLALFFNWKKRHKEEFSEIASGVMSSSFVHGDPIGIITSIVVLAYRYDKSSNKQELRNLKWGVIKGGVSIGAFAITIKAMGVSLVSFLVGVCVAAIVRKSVSTLRFFEYLKFIRTLKVKIPKLKKKISRREFLSMKIFEFKNA
jgi:hypothetical protein